MSTHRRGVNRSAFVVAGVLALLLPRAARAQSPAPSASPLPAPSPVPIALADAIARLFTAPSIDPAWFAPSFLSAVPIDQVRGIVASVVATLGAYRSIAPSGDGFAVTFERGSSQTRGALDASGAFTGLLIGAMQTPLIAERLRAMFGSDPVPAAWFSDRFLAEVPIGKIRDTIATMKTSGGALIDVRPQPDGTYDLSFIGGHVAALAFLGPDGTFEVLRFRPV